ncbi:unnamed protein product [Withania somnifera]
MTRGGLENCDILYDISRLRRKRAHFWNKESESENSDIFRFKRQIRKTKNMDEDYVQYLMLLLDYDEEPKCHTKEEGNEGLVVVGDRLNHDVDEDGSEFENEDEDEDDLDYKKFLANAKQNGNSYAVKMDRSDGLPVFLEFEKEDGSDEEYGHLGQRKQMDSGDEKDLDNGSCKDKVASQPFSRIIPENDNGSAGDNNVIFEPSGPVTQKEKGLTSQKLSLEEDGAHKRRRKDETKNRSNKEQKKGKRRKSAKVTTKEEGADIDEDYALLLETFIRKQWSMTSSFMKKYNLKTQKSSRTVLENDSNISEGYIDMTYEPSDPLFPKKKKKKKLTSQKNSTKGNDASTTQEKGEKRKRSYKKKPRRKRRNLAIVPYNEDLAGTNLVDVTVKEEIATVDEASLIGHSFECKDAEEDLQIVVNDICTVGKEGSSNLVEASLEKHCENVEDSCSRKIVGSGFWANVKALIERPYDPKEYAALWKSVKSRKPTLKDMDLRNGKFYSSRRLGKSYLDHYKDLHKKIKEAENNMKKLNILRGFFFWLQNLTQEGAFRPWTDPEWLSLVDNSTVPTLTFNA